MVVVFLFLLLSFGGGGWRNEGTQMGGYFNLFDFFFFSSFMFYFFLPWATYVSRAST